MGSEGRFGKKNRKAPGVPGKVSIYGTLVNDCDK
jgi:hypothetical protein